MNRIKRIVWDCVDEYGLKLVRVVFDLFVGLDETFTKIREVIFIAEQQVSGYKNIVFDEAS